MSEVKATIVTPEQMEEMDEYGELIFKHPSKYYFIDALGQAIYLHTRDRLKAVEYIKENYEGKYTLRTAKQSSGSGEYTCTGSTSRKGTMPHLKGLRG